MGAMAVHAPHGIGPAARLAMRRAVNTLEAQGEDPDLSRGHLRLYACAVDTLATVRKAWEDEGRPTIAKGSHGEPVRHPLVGAIEDQ